MNDPRPLRAAPKGIAKKLVKLVGRLVDHQARLVRKEGVLEKLTKALSQLLGRDDLFNEARRDAEALQQEIDDTSEL